MNDHGNTRVPTPRDALNESNPGRLLVVDDEPLNRELLKDPLESLGHEVLEAGNGESALRMARQHLPDVILLDVMMPGMDGFEVCRRLKQDPRTKSIPVLIVTALSDRAERLKGIQAGANDFLVKPVDMAETLLRVRNAVHEKQLHNELKDSYRRLQKAEKMRDDLIHMIVHDMRSPLQAMSGFIELTLMANADLKDSVRMNLERSMQAGMRIRDMVDNLLDISRIENGKMPLNHTDFEPRKIIVKVCDDLSALADNRTCRVDAELNGARIRADPDLFRRILVNLLHNAFKFTPKDSIVEIRAQSQDHTLRVEVIDSGPGIPAEHRERIFEKFTQAGDRPVRASSGLGLCFCKLAVEAHGGRIGVEDNPGGGSIFRFELPLPP